MGTQPSKLPIAMLGLRWPCWEGAVLSSSRETEVVSNTIRYGHLCVLQTSAIRPEADKIGGTIKFSCLRVVYQCPLETVAASLEESLFLPVMATLKITYQDLA